MINCFGVEEDGNAFVVSAFDAVTGQPEFAGSAMLETFTSYMLFASTPKTCVESKLDLINSGVAATVTGFVSALLLHVAIPVMVLAVPPARYASDPCVNIVTSFAAAFR